MADIFREVDEDLRHERYLKLWRRYRYWLFGILAVALGGAVVYVVLDDMREEARLEEGGRMAAALSILDSGRSSEAADLLTALAAESETGYAALARLAEADARAKAGDISGAVAAYDAVSLDARVDPLYRELAVLLAAWRSIDRAPAMEIETRLAPLTLGQSVWRPLAVELSGIAALRAGNEEAARTAFDSLVADPAAPPGTRARAAELLESLGGSASEAVGVTEGESE